MIPAPVNGYTPADVLRLAREHNVPGVLVKRNRTTEDRAYAIAGSSVPMVIRALPEAHYAGGGK